MDCINQLPDCRYLKHSNIYIAIWWITLGKYLGSGNGSFQYWLNQILKEQTDRINNGPDPENPSSNEEHEPQLQESYLKLDYSSQEGFEM